MIDYIWELADSPVSDRLYEWKNGGYPFDPTDSTRAPRVTLWPIRGEQPLCSGLTALLAEPFRWLGPARTLIVSAVDPDGGDWQPEMTVLDPSTFTPPISIDAPTGKIWGELEGDQLNIHFSFSDAQSDWSLHGDLVQMVTQLIALSAELQSRLGISPPRPIAQPLDITDPESLAIVLRAWGEINIRHTLIQEGYEEYSDALKGAIRRMSTAALNGSAFACWVGCSALWPVAADFFEEDYQTEAEETLTNLGSAFPRSAWPGILLGLLNWAEGDPADAIDLFETAVEADPLVSTGWLLLALAYSETGDLDKAIAACKEADQGSVADAALYYLWGDLLLMHNPGEDRAMLDAAKNAFYEAEKRGLTAPDLYVRLMDVYEAQEDTGQQWAVFARLLEVDTDGGILWQVVEDADNYDDFEPGLVALQAAIQAAPESYLLLAAYARAMIVLNRREAAIEALQYLRPLANDDYKRAEVAQLALEAAAVDFEEAYGELVDELENGIVADATMIGLLTDALSREPLFADGLVMLAQAYESRDEIDKAVALLTEGRGRLPDHLELTLSLADMYWAADNDEDALTLLQAALATHPNDVALLARIGEYYIETGDQDTAWDYLVRAESLDPRHPELNRVRETIGTTLEGEEFDFDDDDEYSDDGVEIDVSDDDLS